MAKVKTKKISDLHFDDQNINKGSEFGNHLLLKSIGETGLGRSVVTDKNNILIAGNKTAEAAAQLGIEKVIEIESTGKELIVVKRTDLDINSVQGLRHKILDNTVSKHNYREDAEMVAALVEDAEISNLNEFGLSSINQEGGDDVHFKASKNLIKISLSSEQELEYALRDINYLMQQKYPGAIVTAKGFK
jgi:hypothetical protein